MTLDESAVTELLAAIKPGEGTDLVRTLAQWVLQELIEAEAEAHIGAGRWERTEGRVAERNGHRHRTLSTKAGDLDVAIPKLHRLGIGRAEIADRSAGIYRAGQRSSRRRPHPERLCNRRPRSGQRCQRGCPRIRQSALLTAQSQPRPLGLVTSSGAPTADRADGNRHLSRAHLRGARPEGAGR